MKESIKNWGVLVWNAEDGRITTPHRRASMKKKNNPEWDRLSMSNEFSVTRYIKGKEWISYKGTLEMTRVQEWD